MSRLACASRLGGRGRKLAKADVLVIDDLGLGTPTEQQRQDLLGFSKACEPCI
jgi:DNA replication protein DnaC